MSSKQADASIRNRAKPWQLVCFTMNDVAFNVYFTALTFLSYFATGYVGFTVVAAANMLTAMRVFDGITDPIIGVMMDKTSTRFGKFRPFMIGGNLIMAVCTLLMFYTTTSIENSVLRIVYFLILYAIYILGFTCQGAATRGAQSTLTRDPKQRPMVSIVSGTGTNLVSVAAQILVSSYLVVKYNGMTEGFFRELILYAIALSGILTVIAVIGIWEKDRPEFYDLNKSSNDAPKLKFRDYVDVVKHNRGLHMLILAACTDKLAKVVSENAIVAVMVFGIICGNYTLSGTVGAYTIIPTLIVLFFGAMIAGRMGQRKTVAVFSGIAILCEACIFLLFWLGDPTQLGANGFMTALFLALYILMKGAMNVPAGLVIPMIADCSDYEIYRSGRFVPGMMATIFSFIDKTISAFGNTIVGLLIAMIGYTTVQPTIEDACTPAIFGMAMFMWCGLPILGWLCSILAMKWSPLTKEKMAEVQKHIATIKSKDA